MFIPMLAIALSSCSKEKSDCGASKAGEREVELKLSTAIATRTPGEDAEKDIKSIELLVFDRTGVSIDDAKFLYSRYVFPKSASTYSSTLKIGNHLDIYVAVNASSLVNSGQITEGMKWSDARKKLVMTNPDQIDPFTNGLPMWGYVYDYTVADQPINYMGTIKLLRSVASTDVNITATNFTLAKGHIVYGATQGYLPFTPSNMSAPDANGDFKPNSAEIPELTTFDREWYRTPVAGENKLMNVFYMYEQAIVPGQSNTKVILEGRWSGSTQPGNTFYPLAFRRTSDNSKLPVLRNAKYVIIVTNVNGDGYDNIEDAKDAEAVNMQYDVIPWDNNLDGDIMIDGSKYLAMPSKTASLTREVGAEKELIFDTNFDLSDIKMSFDGTNWETLAIDAHPRFKVEVKKRTNSSGVEYNCFVITTKLPYGTTNNPALLDVVVGGRIKFTITMTQLDRNPDDWDEGANVDRNL